MSEREEADPDPLAEPRRAAAASAPVVWLLGKAQSGKTSVVSQLTGEAHGVIGNGFQAATRHSSVYDFPAVLPLVRFLDTRGLGDVADYDPTEDIAWAEGQAHALLVVLRAEDLTPDPVLDVLRAVRKRHPNWPVLVAQTRLHDLYGRGAGHSLPYPFDGTEADASLPDLSPELSRALAAQRRLFAGLPGPPPQFIPVDFTQADAGLAPRDYGADALWEALQRGLPEAYLRLHQAPDPAADARWRVVMPWSLAAAGADAVPVPFAGGLAASGLQARMIQTVARRFGVAMDAELWKKFIRLLGLSFGLRYGGKFLVRQAVKTVPVAGTAMVALWAFSITFALGEAAIYFSRELAAGREPEGAALRRIYAENLARARELWRERQARTSP